MIGTVISHYKILEKLGEGGMGIVYKAHDTKLDRVVALKFLPQHLSANEAEQSRFLQEARAASALNHPNVCGIHAIGEHGDQNFIDMEFVDGVTLRKRLTTGPLPLDTAVAYAIQIGDALQEAHAKTIVHRDIKCENIMINSKNVIKVMDFGLAKLKGTLKLTRTSSTVGTLAYMSPEQIQGGEVDARSDIFSFGVVLFEMLTGHMPFRGDHEAAMMYSILNEEPESVQKYLPEAPSELLHVFGRALEKNPEDRYQSVHDMVIDLRRLKKESTKISRASIPAMQTASQAGFPPVPSAPVAQTQEVHTPSPEAARARKRWLIPSVISLVVVSLGIAAYVFWLPKGGNGDGERLPIAVSDFVNQTGEKELDGLSGMLITAMEQSRRLSVLTRSRMFDILNSMGKTDVDKIDETLGKAICNQADISALVTASIRKFGKLYTIDLKVLDTRKNEYIFTAKEEGEGQENIPSMLDKLSEKTRVGLKEQAHDVKSANVATVTTSNLEAYQHFFQGEQFIDRLKFDEAEKELRKAVELDSTFGLAWYRLTYTLNWNTETNYQANEPLAKALSLINRIPEKEQYLLRALNAEQAEGFGKGLQILHEMERIYPEDKEMLYNIGDWSYHADDMATASRYLEKVLQIVPTFERALQHLTWTYRDMERYEQMVEIAKRYVSASGSKEAYSLLNEGYMLMGQFDQAMKTMQSARELYPKRYEFTGSIAQIDRFEGKCAEAEKELTALIGPDQPNEAKGVGFSGLVTLYTTRGRIREALKASEERMRLYFSANDTAGAINLMLQRCNVYRELRNDATSASREFENALKHGADKRPQTRINLSVWYALHGDLQAIDSLARSIRVARMAILSLGYSGKHDYARAEAYIDSAIQSGLPQTPKIYILYFLASREYDGDQPAMALATMKRVLAINECSRADEYPRIVLLRGKIYQRTGEKKLAIESYEKFLDLWKDADKDLPDYIDATARLAKLKGKAGV